MDTKTLQAVLRDPVSRRQFFNAAGMTTALLLIGDTAAHAENNSAKLPGFPFTLGVASGDPTPDGVVLWTRLAPNPQNGPWDSTRARAVRWQVATDEKFKNIVQQGATLALPQEGHSVHVELTDLQPSTHYWYRFIVDNYTSRIGRAKTAPAANAPTHNVKFAFCSCADFQNGYFAAYRQMAKDDIDFWVFLGDYIYEYDAAQDAVGGRKHSVTDYQLTHGFGREQLSTLKDYRNRYAQYRQDAALQELHATHPVIAIWDDHETENNYANDIDEIGDTSLRSLLPNPPANLADYFQTKPQFLLERAAAYQAWYEHMPIRRGFIVFDGNTPRWKDANLYRSFAFGDLLTLHMLDTRQYRTDQPVNLTNQIDFALGVGFDFRSSIPENAPGTLFGNTQRAWLADGLTQSTTRWNALGNQVMMARFNFNNNQYGLPQLGGAAPNIYNMDQWDGYNAERKSFLTFVQELRTTRRNAQQTDPNVVVLTGDIHSAWAHDLRLATAASDSDQFAQWQDPANTVATEFVCTSITTDFPTAFVPLVLGGLGYDPNKPVTPAHRQTWTKYFNGTNRGYVLCTVTPDEFRADFQGVAVNAQGQVVNPTASVTTVGSFKTRNGVPGAVPA